MKKILLISISIISCLFLVDKVSASSIDVSYVDSLVSNNIDHYFSYDNWINNNFEENINHIVNLFIEKYNSEYSSNYPYYYIAFDKISLTSYSFLMHFVCSKSPFYLHENYHSTYYITPDLEDDYVVLSSSYNRSEDTYNLPYENTFNGGEGLFSYFHSHSSYYYVPVFYFISNFDLYNTTGHTFNITGKENFTINPGDKISPMFTSYEDFINSGDENKLTEVDLNNYPYIILSLKDYSKTEEFSTINYVKGQYCLTSVYNYGSTEKKDIIEGSKTKRCSLYYDDFTPVRTYILDSDLKNNAIYYLKAYDTSKENKVKIDTSVFNIHYITEEDKDNPLITINDKKYTPKSYDELTDTATKSEDENYVDGASEKFSFSDIFSTPLDFLKDIWSSITKVFVLINNFIELLPVPLQYFLYVSFMLAIVLGLIKIIL